MKYNDYELLDLIFENDEIAYDIMLKKYKPVIYGKALEYYNYFRDNNYDGFTFDDFLQEGIITFNHTIKKFDVNKGSLFYSFLLVCLTSSFNIMCRNIFAIKNRPLLKYQELDYEVRDVNSFNPYDVIDYCDLYDKLNDYLYSLSLLDYAIIVLRLNAFKYREIMDLLEVSSSHISRVIKVMKKKFNTQFRRVKEGCNYF